MTSSPIAHREAALLLGRPGQARRQVPGAVGELDERRPSATTARTRPKPQLGPAERDAAADRQLRRPRGAARPGAAGSFSMRTSASVSDGREDLELDAREAHRPLQQLREPLLRQPEHQGLEPVGVPDGVDGEDDEDERGSAAERRAVDSRCASCGVLVPFVARVARPTFEVLHAPGQLARELIEVIGSRAGEAASRDAGLARGRRWSGPRRWGTPPGRRASGTRRRRAARARRRGRGSRSRPERRAGAGRACGDRSASPRWPAACGCRMGPPAERL